MAKISVLGSGTWGSALAILLAHNGHEVTVWSAFQAEIDAMQSTHKHINLPEAVFPDSMEFTADLESAMKGREALVLAVPSVFTRQTARKMKPFYEKGQIIVSVAKGIEEDSLKTLTEQIEEEIPGARIACLCGPSHAEEVSRGLPTTCVAGAFDRETAETIRGYFMSPVFRVYTCSDVLGMELGGSIKNVIALAAGIADGLGCGDNTKAALITRGIHEISRLGVKMGASAQTFAGLTGIGDLIVTCASMHSRNRRAGILIGKGYTMDEAMKEVNQVVEGVYSAKAAYQLSLKYNVSMPIVEAVNMILFKGLTAMEAIKLLMERDAITENEVVSWDK